MVLRVFFCSALQGVHASPSQKPQACGLRLFFFLASILPRPHVDNRPLAERTISRMLEENRQSHNGPALEQVFLCWPEYLYIRP